MSPSKLEILPFLKAISSAICSGSLQLTTGSYSRAQYLNLIGLDFFIFGLVMCHVSDVTLNLAQTSIVKSPLSVPYRANFYALHLQMTRSYYFLGMGQILRKCLQILVC